MPTSLSRLLWWVLGGFDFPATAEREYEFIRSYWLATSGGLGEVEEVLLKTLFNHGVALT